MTEVASLPAAPAGLPGVLIPVVVPPAGSGPSTPYAASSSQLAALGRPVVAIVQPAGSNGALDATPLTADINIVQVAATGALTLAAGLSQSRRVVNKTANPITVYPPIAGQIDQAGANVATLVAPQSTEEFHSVDNLNWVSE